MNSPVSFRIIFLPPYPRSLFLVPFCLRARCSRRGWGWKVFTRFRGTESFWYSRWCGPDKEGTDSSQSSILTRGEIVFLLLLVKIRSRFWSHQILGASEVEFSAISAVCYIASVVTWRPINFRLPAPFLQRCQPQVGFPAPFLQLR